MKLIKLIKLTGTINTYDTHDFYNIHDTHKKMFRSKSCKNLEVKMSDYKAFDMEVLQYM